MTLAERIVRHYGGDWNKGAGQGNIAGEGHSRGDRSVSVKDAPDRPGGVLICVRGSGDWKAEMDRFRRDGLLPPFERPSASGNDNSDRNDWRCTGTYDYDDGNGTVVYRTRRLEKTGEKKRFVAERFEGGRWVNGLGNLARVPYRLAELRHAVGLKNTGQIQAVYFVEGERKADKLISMGFAATAIAFGANGWRDDYAHHLADVPVVVLPDNDDKGQAFAERAKAAIEAAGGVAHLLNLPGLPEKGDIIDWQGTVDDLRRLTDDVISGKPDLLPLADLATWATTAPLPKPFLMAGCIPEREVTLITAIGGGTKSTFGHQLCVSSAAGRQMLGVDVQPGKAFYLTAEDDFDRLHWMHLHICAKVGVPQSALFDRIQLSSVRGRTNNELATFDNQSRIHATPAFTMLKATLAATKAQLLVLDNVAHLFAGNENDRVQVTAFVNLLYSLCRDLGVTVLLIAHPNKSGDAYSGSTAWPNAVRSHLVIEKPEGSHNPHERKLRVEKANYAKPGEELRFVWHDFALWLESEIPSDTRAELDAVIRANGERAAFLRCLAKATDDRRAVSHHKGTNYYAKTFAAMTEAKGFAPQAFERAFESLLHTGEIKLDQPLWRGANRLMKHGIVLAADCTDPLSKTAENRAPTPALTPCTDPHEPLVETRRKPCTDLHAPTPPYTTYKSGVASWAATPEEDEKQGTPDYLAGWGTRAEVGHG